MTKYRRNFLRGDRTFFDAMLAGRNQGLLVNHIAALWASWRNVNAVYTSGIELKSHNPGIELRNLRKRLP
ncbi:hypothetical protein SAMN05216308_101184 [Nitrosospira sp. Nsp13]|nr:hypothetical protein SAMN05216308_101184 [Nitrosospira sp. Nsp13]